VHTYLGDEAMIIWGIRWFATTLGQLLYSCSNCGKKTAHSAVVQKGWFTLFFIPLIPIGKKYLIVCNLCGLRLKAVDNLKAQLEGWAKTGRFPDGQTVGAGMLNQ
jgi:DNA-directed RNA polymerase subunit RPC12/RpoP